MTEFAVLRSARLRQLAELVPSCEAMIDVGTDHGLLPIELVLSGRVQHAIASDRLPSPLAAARRHISAYCLEQRVFARLGEGLETLKAGEAEVVTIAGVGAKTILSILSQRRPDQLGAKRLIVQTPQVDNPLRVVFESEFGWHIDRELLLLEADTLYHTLSVDLERAPPSPLSTDQHEDLLDEMISPALRAQSDTEQALSYLSALLLRRLELKQQGLRRAALSRRDELEKLTLRIARLRRYLEELDQA